jgi:hypothetical protein
MMSRRKGIVPAAPLSRRLVGEDGLHGYPGREHAIRTHLCRGSVWQQEPHLRGRLACRRLRRASSVPGHDARQEGCNRFVSHLLRGIARHDGRDPRHGRAGDKVAIRATYRGTDVGGFIPNMPATGKAFEMEAMYLVRLNNEGQVAEHWGVVDTIGTMGQLGLLPRP